MPKGRPPLKFCKRGHDMSIYKRGRNCVMCLSIRQRLRYQNNPEYRAYHNKKALEYYYAHKPQR